MRLYNVEIDSSAAVGGGFDAATSKVLDESGMTELDLVGCFVLGEHAPQVPYQSLGTPVDSNMLQEVVQIIGGDWLEYCKQKTKRATQGGVGVWVYALENEVVYIVYSSVLTDRDQAVEYTLGSVQRGFVFEHSARRARPNEQPFGLFD